MRNYILKENVLTDNVLSVADKNKVFKGGFIAILKEYTYKNSWSDKETIVRFRSKNSLFNYLDKKYKNCMYDLDFTNTTIEP